MAAVVLREKATDEQGNLREMVIWRVEPNPRQPEGLRYRLALLHAIKNRQPNSIYELARMTGRDLKNVQEDIGILERHGLVQIIRRQRGSRKVKVPRVPFEEIALMIAI